MWCGIPSVRRNLGEIETETNEMMDSNESVVDERWVLVAGLNGKGDMKLGVKFC
jgi:hypothetical protein